MEQLFLWLMNFFSNVFLAGVDREFLLQLMPYIRAVRSLCLKQSQLDNLVLSSFQGSSLESLNVSNTMVSVTAVNLDPPLKHSYKQVYSVELP